MENEEMETGLTVSGANQLQTGLFGKEESFKKVTSIDLNDSEQVDMLLNGMQQVDHKLNDCVSQEIKVVACYITEKEMDSFNEETGEDITRKKHVLMLFDEKGESYVTGSNACYFSFMNIVSIKGLPTKENPLILKPIKVDAEEKGHSYLKLSIVIKKDL